MSLFTDMTIDLEMQWNLQKKLLELISEFIKLQDTRSIYKS